MISRASLSPVVVAFAAIACTHADRAASAAPPPEAAAARPGPGGGMAGRCPMSVPGTQVSAADTATGEALTFTTSPDQVPALQERVHAMADMHNQHHAAGDAGHMHGMMAEGMGKAGMGSMQMPPPSQAAVEDLPDGARILVTPTNPADLSRLQATVRAHAEHMQQHGCGMMQSPPAGS